MEMSKELLEKAKCAKNAEELMALAKENGIELTHEQANIYFSNLHPTCGEIPDDDLDNVAGGGCGGGNDDEWDMKVIGRWCKNFKCGICGVSSIKVVGDIGYCSICGREAGCTDCAYMEIEEGQWICKR